jgi:hypothetical protein
VLSKAGGFRLERAEASELHRVRQLLTEGYGRGENRCDGGGAQNAPLLLLAALGMGWCRLCRRSMRTTWSTQCLSALSSGALI